MATLALNARGVTKIRRLAGLSKDKDFADRIGIDQSTLSRVLTGKAAPGPRFIAGCVEAFGADVFEDLFTVADDAA